MALDERPARSGRAAASGRRLLCFVAETVVVAFALGSPVDRFGEPLFRLHMTQIRR